MNETNWRDRLAALLTLAALLLAAGRPAAAATRTDPVRLIQADSEMAEEEVLDIGVLVFDSGLPDLYDDPEAETALEEKGIFREVRRSEARFFAVHLANTLQQTGHWGAVRVVPADTDAVDVLVSGTILESNGRELALKIVARDAAGREWLDKRYRQKADPRGYDEEDPAEERLEPVDPFGSLYNRIANDLLAARDRLDPEELRELRTVAQLHFASDLAPTAFRDYLVRDRRGLYEVDRLPSTDDPMLQRVLKIRDRDYLLVDTYNEQYATFYAEMERPYSDWRAYAYAEEVALAKLRKQARMQKILGAVSVAAGVLVGGGGDVGNVARDAAIIGGQMAIMSGIYKSKEAKIHREAIRELAASFDSEVAPMVVEIEGQTLKLSGTAETQYSSWRELLREIWTSETGITLDPDNPTELSGEAAPEG